MPAQTGYKILLARLNELARKRGLSLAYNNPGDGVRIRYYPAGDESDFFGPSNPLVSIHSGISNRATILIAEAWADGYAAGKSLA